ncbi:hypothetical protein HanRHA438_Chr17g0835041 [Helianthus annuus]|nr:hypothetical protein HanRHA438_Chr17g0835041 [Helianthus annuus]
MKMRPTKVHRLNDRCLVIKPDSTQQIHIASNLSLKSSSFRFSSNFCTNVKCIFSIYHFFFCYK